MAEQPVLESKRERSSRVQNTFVDCDIVLPVYNGLTYVMEALDSVFECTRSVRYRLLIIDDASDTETARYLTAVAERHEHVRVLRNGENVGFVQSCIRGYEAGEAPFLLLLNSDVVVTPGWLERLLACAASDPRIAAVNPFTNHAAQINLPLAPGANFFGMDEALQHWRPTVADVVTGVGFCLLLRRSVLEQLGFFDEVYGRGYCEESDLCMRLTTHGYRTVVASNIYVYHKGRGTFTDRGERYRRNRAIFDARWDREYRRQFRAFRKANPLGPSRARFATPHQYWDPMPVIWETARAMLAARRRHAWLDLARSALRGALRLPTVRRPLATPEFVHQFTRPGRLRITYVLPRLVIAGGVLSVIQLVNQLILSGVEARIVTLFEDPAIYDWTPLYTRPLVFRDERDLLQNFPNSDLAVATLWSTAPWIAGLVERGRARTAVYFLQDYEPWFFPETDSAARQRVRATYALIPHRIVKSDWLRNLLASDGYDTHIIRLGMNLARFYPRDAARDRPVVLAMARPGTPYRGFEPTIAALAQVKAARPEVEIVLFGDSALDRHAIPFEYRDERVIADQDRLARIYSEADVFLDGSDFQGFGRGGLEAMACGAACVLTEVGGVNEYARDGYNAWMVPPRRPDQFAEAILSLLDNPPLRARLAAAGRETVQRFCHRREARETLDYFRSLMAEQESA